MADFVQAQTEIARISNGYIQGVREQRSFVFKGIPYAQPPIGNLRFKASRPALNWRDTLLCEEFKSVASQVGSAQSPLKGSENCLTLNVYTPSAQNNAGLPVLVWIHGGAMTAGSGMNQNGHAFSGRDSIVTVTINYRLGAFGFLNLSEMGSEYSGSANNGLMDCVLALRWVNENIRFLGGDPEKVTVMGESAGAKLASALLVTSGAKKYFQQMVLESGGVQCIRDSATANAIRDSLLKELHITDISQLLITSTEKLIAAQAKVCKGAQGTNYFGPVEDGILIAGDPYKTIGSKLQKSNIRFLMGSNKEEARLFMDLDKRLYSPDATVLRDWFGSNCPFVLASLKQVSASGTKDVLSEYMYQMHSNRLAICLAKAKNTVWMYRFDQGNNGLPATHAEELQYVWYSADQPQPNQLRTALAKSMHADWVAFIKGNDFKSYWPVFKPSSKKIRVYDQSPHQQKINVFNDKALPSAVFKINN